MKASMAKVSAILAIVFSIFSIIGGVALVILGLTARAWVFSHWENTWSGGFPVYNYVDQINAAFLVIGIFLFIFAIIQIIVAAQILKRVGRKDPNLNGLLIGLLILTIFGGSWITLIFVIIALCSRLDYEGQGQQVYHSRGSGNTLPRGDDLNSKIARLKQYKEDGIIDDAMYKKKLQEIVEQM